MCRALPLRARRRRGGGRNQSGGQECGGPARLVRRSGAAQRLARVGTSAPPAPGPPTTRSRHSASPHFWGDWARAWFGAQTLYRLGSRKLDCKRTWEVGGRALCASMLWGRAPDVIRRHTHSHPASLVQYSPRSLARDALPRLHDEPCPSGASKRTSRRCEWTRCHIPSLWGPAFAPALRRDDDESQSKPARLPARSSNPPSWLAGCGCISCL